MFFKKIGSLLRKKPQTLQPQTKTPLDLLNESGRFDATWYSSNYPEIANHSYWGKNLSSHYLTIGGFEGKNPTQWFNSTWYLQQYPDVKAAQINPFLHYLIYGKAEHRYPNPYKHKMGLKATQRINKDQSNQYQLRLQLQRLNNHLWGGHSLSALQELEKIYNNEAISTTIRALSLWNTMRWLYFTGDIHQVIQLCSKLEELDIHNTLQKERALVLAYCHFENATAKAAIPLLEGFMQQKPDDPDCYFALANCYMDDDYTRLSLINSAFAKAGLAPIGKKNQQLPLSIHNIKGLHAQIINKSQKVSVIMPVFNAELYLATAVQSLLQQSWQNIEVIIVDDCSTDQTFLLAQQLATEDQRVVALRQQENSGAYPARNLGLKYATGDFITTHDADDWSHPQKIETQLKRFEQNPELKGLCTHWIRTKQSLFFTQNWRPHNALIHWSHSSFIFKKEVASQLGGWDEVRVSGDTEYIWRLKAYFGQNSYELIRSDIPLAFALDEESSLTRTKNTHVKTVYFGLRHIYREISAYRHRTKGQLQIVKNDPEQNHSLPLSIIYRDNRTVELDILIISDFAHEVKTAQIKEFVLSLTDVSNIGLFHWPEFQADIAPLTTPYFNLLQSGAVPVVSGEVVNTRKVYIFDDNLLNYPLDHMPQICNQAEFFLVTANIEDESASQRVRTLFNQPPCIKLIHELKPAD